ncbi:hypothetical protein [Actinoplanes sp. ATCC 53533]|nr:hypothetical protein [Actinoplanes sp. ATCC 53533]
MTPKRRGIGVVDEGAAVATATARCVVLQVDLPRLERPSKAAARTFMTAS